MPRLTGTRREAWLLSGAHKALVIIIHQQSYCSSSLPGPTCRDSGRESPPVSSMAAGRFLEARNLGGWRGGGGIRIGES